MRLKVATGIAVALMATIAAAQTPPAAGSRPTINPRGLQCDSFDGARLGAMTADERLALYCGYEMAHYSASDTAETTAAKPASTEKDARAKSAAMKADLARLERCSRAMNTLTDVMIRNRETSDCRRIAGYKPQAAKEP